MTCRSSSVYSIGTGRLQDPCARAVFEACQGRIRAIALVHEWLYRARDDHLDLGQYLGQLARPLFGPTASTASASILTLQADAVSVAADTAIPCGLLVHEVLVNCVTRLTHPTPRMITPCASTLTIRDTGLGWPGHGAVGAAEEFGLHLIRALTEQLQGTLTFTREGGTGVTLRFPSDRRESGGVGASRQTTLWEPLVRVTGRPCMARASTVGVVGHRYHQIARGRARQVRATVGIWYRPTEITGIDARARMCRAASIPSIAPCQPMHPLECVGLGHRVRLRSPGP